MKKLIYFLSLFFNTHFCEVKIGLLFIQRDIGFVKTLQTSKTYINVADKKKCENTRAFENFEMNTNRQHMYYVQFGYICTKQHECILNEMNIEENKIYVHIINNMEDILEIYSINSMYNITILNRTKFLHDYCHQNQVVNMNNIKNINIMWKNHILNLLMVYIIMHEVFKSSYLLQSYFECISILCLRGRSYHTSAKILTFFQYVDISVIFAYMQLVSDILHAPCIPYQNRIKNLNTKNIYKPCI